MTTDNLSFTTVPLRDAGEPYNYQNRSHLQPTNADELPACRHCYRPFRTGRSRKGLCGTCYDDPVIRRAFPKRPSGGIGVPEEMIVCSGPASVPTTFPPGSAGKIEVMRGRYERMEEIFHPEDFEHARE